MKRKMASQVCVVLLLLFTAAPLLADANSSVPDAQLLGGLYWRNIGPFVGGRAIAITGVAQMPGVFYLGAVGGGVWKSADYGSSWKNVSDPYFRSDNIGAIAVAPSDPNVVYVGTGESDIRNTTLTGDGVYKTTDAGKTWTPIGLTDTHIISRIVVDPDNANVVYVAALGHVFGPNSERGIYKSIDGGQSWSKVLFVNDQTGAIDLAINPKNPRILYAAMWQADRRAWTFSSGGPGSGIYESKDGGEHWTNITHNEGLPKGVFGKIGLAVAPSDPSVLYAIIQAQTGVEGKPGGVYRSDDAGHSWTLVNTSTDLTQRAFYYMTIYVDPKDPNTVYMPQVSALWVSRNGGKKFTEINTPHGDNHGLWIDPSNPQIMAEANDGGGTVTIDGGKSWTTELDQPTGQFYHVDVDNQFPFHVYGAQQDEGSFEGPSATYTGGIPGGMSRNSFVQPTAWTRLQGGEASWVVPVPGKPWITFASGYYTLLWKENRRTGFIQSVSPWPEYKSGEPASALKYRFAWIHHPIVFAPNNPNELLIGSQYVLQSKDLGASWQAISPDLTRNDKSKQGVPGGQISHDASSAEIYDTISAMSVSPLNNNIIWVGSDDGLVHVTTDDGAHWREVRPQELPTWAIVTSLEASHDALGTAYLTASRYMWDDFKPYVYKTTDYGQHWTALTSGLPNNQYLESVRQDPNDPNLLFLASDKTVFTSLDNGGSWIPLTLNLPPVRVDDIAIQAKQHAVVLATHGRAFWVMDDLGFLEQLSHAQVADNSPYLFKPQQAWMVIPSLRSSVCVGHSCPMLPPQLQNPTRTDDGGNMGQDILPGVAVFFSLPKNYDGSIPVKVTFTTTQGKVVNSYTLPIANKGPAKEVLHAGVNRFQWDLRYPTAVAVKGSFIPSPAGGDAGDLEGPIVIPGTYDVVLNYGGSSLTQQFEVKLDPRVTTTQQQLQDRLAMLLQIDDMITRVDTLANQALDVRTQLETAVSAGHVSSIRAKTVLAALSRDIGDVVNLKIQSAEGDLTFQTKLHFHLAFFANDIMEYGLGPLTPGDHALFENLTAQAEVGETRLQSDIADATKLLRP